MRKKIVAGNWKMNNNLQETETLINSLNSSINKNTTASVMIAPTYTNLSLAQSLTKDSPIETVAQNMHFAENGAYTGEISADMLLSLDIKTVILGHSERRAYFGEDDALLAKKVDTAIAKGMTVIFCFGEELADRQSSKHFDVVKSQLENGVFHLKDSDWKQIILAYEPVWAIGTGETASPEQAQEMHQFIRTTTTTHYNQNIADSVSILYGGSVKPANAQEIFSQPDVDGGLIGGAALQADDFNAIINAI